MKQKKGSVNSKTGQWNSPSERERERKRNDKN